MRVLVLSSKSPYPIHDGAAIRTFQSIVFLHRMGYEVDVLYLSEQDDKKLVEEGLSKYCRNIYQFTMSATTSRINVLRGVFTNGLPLQVNYFFSRKVKKWITKHQDDYDMVYCNNIRTAEYAKVIRSKKVLDFVDALSMNYSSAKNKTKGLWHWIYTLDSYRCSKYEVDQLKVFDKNLIISDVDRRYILKSVTGEQPEISVIENFVRIDKSKRIDQKNVERNILFVGAMNYEPNVTAVTYFVKEVFPSVLKKCPDAKFYIVGKSPREEVKMLASNNVVVTGFVDDVWDYLKNAMVVVTPMRSGAGLQNKILEALAVGACVVTSDIGFEGLRSAPGQPIVARDAKEMTEAVLAFISDVDYRIRQSELSVEYVFEYYSEDGIFKKFENALR
ncbi:MAG: glycosyltransferase [Prevotella sp.]